MRSVEARIDVGEVNVTAPKTLTLRDLLARYSNEITPEKKGRDQEQRRINRLLKDQISDYRLSQLSSAVMAEFRDRRIIDGVRAAQIDLNSNKALHKARTARMGRKHAYKPSRGHPHTEWHQTSREAAQRGGV